MGTDILHGFKDGYNFFESSLSRKIAAPISTVDTIMKKSIIGDGFEKLKQLPCESDRKLKADRKVQRSKAKGDAWYNLPAPKMTPELKNDLEVLQMRSALDTKHFYKKNDLKVLPKYFQVGTVMDSPYDFYTSRIPKKLRKKTMVDELMADAEFQRANKRRYLEVIQQKKKLQYKAHRHAQRLKKRKKH